MENLDFVIFTAILIVLFVAFAIGAIGTLSEFDRMGKETYDPKDDKGGIVALKNFIGKILLGSSK